MGIPVNDLKIPDHFYEMVVDWRKLLGMKSLTTMVSIAIYEYNEKIKNLPENQLEKIRNQNQTLINYWMNKKYINENARGVSKK